MRISNALKAGFAAFALSMMVASVSLAEENRDKNALEDLNANSITMGSFKVQPKLYLQQNYNDNVFAAHDDKKGDFISTISPSLYVEKRLGRHQIEFQGRHDTYRYAQNTTENIQNYNTQLKGTLEGYHNLIFPFSVRFLKDHKARNQERNTLANRSSEPTAFKRLIVEGGVTYQPNRFKNELLLRHEERSYEDGVTTAGVQVVNRDSNFHQSEIEETVSYTTLRDWEPFISLLVGRTDFLRNAFDGLGFNGHNMDSDNLRGLIGLKFNYKGLLIGKIAAGHFWKNYISDSIKDTDSTSLDASVVWKPSERASFTTTAFRKSIEDNDITQGLIQTFGGIDLDYELESDLFLKSLNSLTFEQQSPGTREDTIYENGLGLYYVINPRFQIGGTVSRRSRESTDENLSYDQNIFMLRLDSAL